MQASPQCRFIGSILLFVLLSLSSCFFKPKTPDPAIQFTFLQVNDVYEVAALAGGKQGGMSRVAALKKSLLTENPHTFAVLAGDFLNPSVMGTIKLDGKRIKGAQMVDIMNKSGIDYVTFGNHEFDLDEEELQARLDESSFEWIGSNVQHKSGNTLKPFAINGKEVPSFVKLEIPANTGPLRIGILGLCIDSNEPDYVQIDDYVSSAQRLYAQYEDAVDIMIGLTHLSIDEDKALAKALPQLALIMGGHEHNHMYVKVGETPIAKADANAKNAYVHRCTYHEGKLDIDSRLVMLDEKIAEDPQIA